MKNLIAAIDLGSNSFQLQVARIEGDQIYPLDGLKESVRLAAGLSTDRYLDQASQARGIAALSQFKERLSGFAPSSVRAVATNTLRIAKNAPAFLEAAQTALGFPIEIISGREEARLIYVGVAHTLPAQGKRQLVVDIGGGSTEIIIGKNFEPKLLESLYMGCVSFSLRHFPSGKIDKASLKAAELHASQELDAIIHAYRSEGWEEAVASSGSAKAIRDILIENNLTTDKITLQGLSQLKEILLSAGHIEKLKLNGLREDRLPVLLGGFSILSAVFKAFGLTTMSFSEGALRLGVLYDLLGRYHHEDLRDATTNATMVRYSVDARQARQVMQTALHFYDALQPLKNPPDATDRRFLIWAAKLHEIGISIAHASYHKHSAYILANAEMPGFSRMDQTRLSQLVIAHRGKLTRVADLPNDSADWLLIACLRLAVVIHRARDDRGTPPATLRISSKKYTLQINAQWLEQLPLTQAALEDEQNQWGNIGRELKIQKI